MARLDINPIYRPLLEACGLTAPEAFLRLSGEIWSGHPDRNVSYLTLGDGEGALRVFLKREHCIRWRDRPESALAGFGLVSKSRREFAMLSRLAALGMPCPEPVAAGEDGHGRAFLLVRAADAVELRTFLNWHRDGALRRRLAKRLGRELARLHDAGIDHPDLYAKHILVKCAASADEPLVIFLDWQRSRFRKALSWPLRFRDLAALDATLADELTGERDRLLVLRTYLRSCAARGPTLKMAARAIRAKALRLLQRRRIREVRQPAVAVGEQSLIWLDGEALCVTRQFREEIGERLPEYLAHVYAECGTTAPAANRLLFRRSARCVGRWIISLLRRRRVTSPELHQAAAIFRLERFRVPAPRLLAMGQRHTVPWRVQSFVLVETPQDAVRLSVWWRQCSGAASARQRREVIVNAARCLRSIHDAGYLMGEPDDLLVRFGPRAAAEAVLGSVAALRKADRVSRADLVRQLHRFRRLMAPARRADQLRFLLSYLHADHVTAEAREIVAALPGRKFSAASRRAGA